MQQRLYVNRTAHRVRSSQIVEAVRYTRELRTRLETADNTLPEWIIDLLSSGWLKVNSVTLSLRIGTNNLLPVHYTDLLVYEDSGLTALYSREQFSTKFRALTQEEVDEYLRPLTESGQLREVEDLQKN